MIDRNTQESQSFRTWLTSEVRGKVAELTQRPGGDFCAGLAGWLIDAGHVQLPSDVRARDGERAVLRAQRDRAWHELTAVERQLGATEPAPLVGPAEVTL